MNKAQESYQKLLDSRTLNEKIEYEAEHLALEFMSLVDEAMIKHGFTQKELAEEVGTSASYITQLMRANKLPNFKMLAKFKDALDINFTITTEEKLKTHIMKACLEYSYNIRRNKPYRKDILNYSDPMKSENSSEDFDTNMKFELVA